MTYCKKEQERDFWREFQFPKELEYMLKANYYSHGYCSKGILSYLLDHFEDNEDFHYGVQPQQIIVWIDQSLEWFFPTEFYDVWVNNQDDLRAIIARQNKLLQKIGPSNLNTGYRFKDDDGCFNIVKYYQKNILYSVILDLYSGEYAKMTPKLEQLLEASKRNVNSLLSLNHLDQLDFILEDELGCYHYPGTDEIEVVNWLLKEYVDAHGAVPIAKAYERYCLFLNELEEKSKIKSAEYQAALHRLLSNAENRLQKFCDRILFELDDMHDENEERDQLLFQDMYCLKTIITRSENRHIKQYPDYFQKECCHGDILERKLDSQEPCEEELPFY